MKKTGTFLIGVMFMAFPLLMRAQETGWQFRAGVGSSGLYGGVTNIEDRLGFHVGVNADIQLTQNGVMRFQPGLELARKGWKFNGYTGNEQIMEAKFYTQLDYLQVPLIVASSISLGQGSSITFRTGTYVAYGLTAKTRMEVQNTDHKETFPENHFSKECDFGKMAYDKESHNVSYPKFQRWDAGLVVGIDLTFGHFMVGCGGTVGLVKLCDPGFMGNTVGNIFMALFGGGSPKNVTADISLGYTF